MITSFILDTENNDIYLRKINSTFFNAIYYKAKT